MLNEGNVEWENYFIREILKEGNVKWKKCKMREM